MLPFWGVDAVVVADMADKAAVSAAARPEASAWTTVPQFPVISPATVVFGGSLSAGKNEPSAIMMRS